MLMALELLSGTQKDGVDSYRNLRFRPRDHIAFYNLIVLNPHEPKPVFILSCVAGECSLRSSNRPDFSATGDH